MTIDYRKMTAPQMMSVVGMDASKWSEAYCQHFPDADEGTILGWFANAIMAGYDHGAKKACQDKDALIAEQAAQIERLRHELRRMTNFYERAVREFVPLPPKGRIGKSRYVYALERVGRARIALAETEPKT